MNIEIIEPIAENTQEVSNLFSKVITHTFKKENILNSIELKGEIKNQILDFKKCLENNPNLFLIAKFESEIIATISYASINEIIKENTLIDPETFEIKSVYVLPEFQEIGIGSQMFREILKKLKARNSKTYCLDCGYQSAQQFWTKKIGPPFKTLKNYWGKGLDHNIWLKNL